MYNGYLKREIEYFLVQGITFDCVRKVVLDNPPVHCSLGRAGTPPWHLCPVTVAHQLM